MPSVLPRVDKRSFWGSPTGILPTRGSFVTHGVSA
jgi:hypothetical protein